MKKIKRKINIIPNFALANLKKYMDPAKYKYK